MSSSPTRTAVPPGLRVVRLTPAGRGAVATLLFDGPGARDVVGSMLRAKGGRSLDSLPPDCLVLGHIGDAGEEVVVRCQGEDRVKVHCHGGRAPVGMIQELAVERGCRAVDWREWVVSQCEDPIRAAALRALAEARTERTAAILLDQYNGALGQAFVSIQRNLADGRSSAASDEIETLFGRAPLGLHLLRPWRVALAGPPNVGKSTLLNAILGYARAITHPAPGTTRDVVTVATAVDGWPIELFDTAGLRSADDATERAGLERARAAVALADLVLWVHDRSRATVQDPRWRPPPANAAKVLSVLNKCDLAPAEGENEHPPGILVSALKRQGIDALLQAIADHLVPAPPSPGAAVPFDAEHMELLNRFRERTAGHPGG